MFKKTIPKPSVYNFGMLAGRYIGLSSSKVFNYVIDKIGSELDTKTGLEILIFINALLYIIVDREAYSRLTDEDRTMFSDGMTERIISDVSFSLSKPEEAKPIILKEFNARLSQLSPFGQHLSPEGDNSPAGTLFWEFSNILNDEYNIELVISLGVIKLCAELLTELYSETDRIFAGIGLK